MIPEGWSATELGKLAHFSSGGTPSKQRPEFWGGDYPWISGKDLKTHYLKNSIDKLSSSGFFVAKKAPKGATLILVRGMTLLKDFPVGYATKEMAYNQDVKALLPANKVNPLFLSYLLLANKNKIRQLVSIAGHGTGRIDTNTLKEFPVNLPPTTEQTKIATILFTYDKAIETVEKLINNSRTQKKSLMQQLLTGKKRLPGFSRKWNEHILGDLGKTYNGLTGKTKDDFGNGKPFIPYINIFKNDRIDTKKLNLVSIKKNEKQSRAIFGDIFFTTSSETPDEIGMSSVLLHETEELYLNSFCFGFRLQDFNTLTPEYSRYLLRSLSIRRAICKLAQGSTRYNLSKPGLMKINLRLPPVDEQKLIVQVLNNAGDDIKNFEHYRRFLASEKKSLMQQLLSGKRRVKIDAAA